MPDARRRTSLSLLAVLLATLSVPVLAEPAVAAPTTFVVDTADDPAPDGGCDQPDDDNTCSLREAVMAANANSGVDTIVFAAGLTGGEPTTVFLQRPFVGTPDGASDGDLDVLEPVTIDGDGLVTVDAFPLQTQIETSGYDRVLDIDHQEDASATTLIGLGITGGHPQLSSGERDGGGIRAQALALVLTDVFVHGNVAPNGRGGGLHFSGGTLEVSGSTFLDNTGNDGGGVWTRASSVEISDSTIAGNTLVSFDEGQQSWPVGNGGGVHLLGRSALLKRVSVADNGADGEVISSPVGSLTSETPSHGGGVAVSPERGAGDTVDIDDVTFQRNIADEGGALWLGFEGSADIDGSTFEANSARFLGGGIYNIGGSLSVVNSTLTGNGAVDGTGLFSEFSASASLTNVTVHENRAAFVGEGSSAAIVEGESSGITITNTIVTDNVPRDCRGAIASGGHNIDSDGTCLTTAPTAAGDQSGVDDIGIGTLGNHGGPTPTLPLLSGSPAIDAGNDEVCEEIAGGVDQRNVERPVDGDGDGEATCDVGAFERTDTFERTDPVVSVSATDDGAEAGPDHGSFTLSLAEPAPEAVTVTFGLGGTATRGPDYTLHRGSAAGAAINGSSVTIGAGATSVVVAVKVIDDSVVEDDETVVLTLTHASPGSVGTPPAGTVTIVDDDRDEQEAGGEDRIETSIEVASLHFARGSAPIVIIARSDDYADALTGAPLARFLDGPILLTTKDVLDPRIATFIRDHLGSTEAYILGETEAISEQVETQLQTEAGITTIRRIGGVNRFETSGDIARFLASELGPTAFAPTQFHAGEVHAYVTEGIHPDPLRGWPDAVSVSALAAEQLHPILLVRRDAVPLETHQALDDIGADSATIIGGPVAVSEDVEFALALTGVDVDRVGGVDRYDTSRLVADLMKASGMSPKVTWLATGLNFPDALVAGPAVAIDDGILLLIHGLDLAASPASEEWLDENGAAIRFLRFLGGLEAITEAVREQVRVTID